MDNFSYPIVMNLPSSLHETIDRCFHEMCFFNVMTQLKRIESFLDVDMYHPFTTAVLIVDTYRTQVKLQLADLDDSEWIYPYWIVTHLGRRFTLFYYQSSIGYRRIKGLDTEIIHFLSSNPIHPKPLQRILRKINEIIENWYHR